VENGGWPDSETIKSMIQTMNASADAKIILVDETLVLLLLRKMLLMFHSTIPDKGFHARKYPLT
jgi:hypothetical protein